MSSRRSTRGRQLERKNQGVGKRSSPALACFFFAVPFPGARRTSWRAPEIARAPTPLDGVGRGPQEEAAPGEVYTLEVRRILWNYWFGQEAAGE